MKRLLNLVPLAAVALIIAGCQHDASSADKLYPLKGKVIAVDVAAKTVMIDHEDIPGLMKAMKMTFSVEDAKILDGISPGSLVEGKVKHASDKYVLTELKAHGAGASEKAPDGLAELSAADRLLAEAQGICPSSNEALGSMGRPVKLTLKGQTVFICCDSCKDNAESNPDAMLKKVAAAKSGAKK